MSNQKPLKLVMLPWLNAGTSYCPTQPLARRSFWRLKSTSERQEAGFWFLNKQYYSSTPSEPFNTLYIEDFLHLCPRLRTCSWHLPRRHQLSTAGSRTQKKTWRTQWDATPWRRFGHCVKPTKPSAPHWAQPRQTSTSWLSRTSRSRAIRWCPTPTLGSPWRPWKRPGGTYRRSSRSPLLHFTYFSPKV